MNPVSKHEEEADLYYPLGEDKKPREWTIEEILEGRFGPEECFPPVPLTEEEIESIFEWHYQKEV
jgi:hypothetical protein